MKHKASEKLDFLIYLILIYLNLTVQLVASILEM